MTPGENGTPGFQKLGERVLHEGHVVTLAVGTFCGPAGEEFEREVIHHPGAVAVVPVLVEGGSATVLLVRQYRSSFDEQLLELPAGKLDVDGEDLPAAAGRELQEEIGQQAGRLVELMSFYNSPGFCDEVCTVYLGLDLEECASSAQGIEEQHMTVERIAFDEALAMVADGRIRDAKTVIGLLLARERLFA